MYRGRFAPSPTGPLHFGSLLAATASYLDARANQGQWLLRIEDTDHSRCRREYTSLILSTLEAFGFAWAGPVLYQSDRGHVYQATLEALGPRVYSCTCTRRELAELHPCPCRQGHDGAKPIRALRLRVDDPRVADDFILFTVTGNIFAYQLAVVVDDELQGVTHVVRGTDLLPSVPRQQYLQRLLGYRTLSYLHIPLATHPDGAKLSKQNLAPAVSTQHPSLLLTQALEFLGQAPPPDLETASLAEVWAWAIAHWRAACVPAPSIAHRSA